MKTRPIEGAPFGVEILDFDPQLPLSVEFEAEFRQLFDRCRLIMLRGEDVGAEAHVALVNALAPVVREGTNGELYSLNSTVISDAYIPGRGGIPFHSDYMFSSHGPIAVASLAALKLETDEPTIFTDSIAAQKKLPEELRRLLNTTDLVQCQSWGVDESGETYTVTPTRMRVSDYAHVPPEQFSLARYPAIATHPRTGEDVLMHSEFMTSHIDGLTESESEAVFEKLKACQYLPEDTYRHNWREGDLLIWDNFALQHGRPPLGAIGERLLRRVAANLEPISVVMEGTVPGRAANLTTCDVAA